MNTNCSEVTSPTRLNRPTVLFVSFLPWDRLWSRPQHLAQQLAGRCNVLYVCPIPFHARSGTLSHIVKGWRLDIDKSANQLDVLSFPFFPSRHFDLIRRWNHLKWASAVSNYLERKQISVDILWLSSPEQLPFVDKISARLVCYECMDNYESFFPSLASIEPDLFRRADVVFVTSPLLEEKARKYSNEVHLVPNGVEVEIFRTVLEKTYPLPSDMINIPAPRIGYIGTIAGWIDYEILEDLSKDTDASVVLIGPVDSKRARRLAEKGRVHLLGHKPYRDLPSYLAHLSVCIIPFQDTELTRAVDPIKVYEYLAAGKDVVSTPLPALVPLAELIVQASPSKFSDAVRGALQSPAPLELRERRSSAMSAHSWKSRAEQILTVFAKKGLG